tara:strand:+ start:14970 stop:16871 length:1902 start_codon:yes stop_codon:yes gene_type:complete
MHQLIMKELKNKRIFISGGAGVIGSEMVDILTNHGAIVLAGDLKSKPIGFENIEYWQGDLNYITYEKINNFQPELFFHLAATFERSEETYGHYEENYWHNIRLSNYLMGILRKIKSIKKVINASSYLIYKKDLYNFERPLKKPIKLKETDPIKPRNLTGMAKLAHEIELNFLSNFHSNQFTSISARIFRGYGKGSKDVISRWIKNALNGETIKVYNKENIFDYIYARDTAEGLIRLSLTNYEGIVNLGTGNSKKVSDIVNILKHYFKDLSIEYQNPKIGYESSEADISKLSKIIRWSPRYSIKKTIPIIINHEKNKNNKIKIYKNILITSLSNKFPLINAVKKSVRKINPNIKIFGADSSENILGKHFVDKFWKMPSINNLNITSLENYCKDNKIGMIIPTRDGELEYLSKIKNRLQRKDINIMVSNTKSVKACLDKLHFSLISNINSIPSYTDINLINENRVVMKERHGAGGINIKINITKEKAIQKSNELKEPIFQPYLEGREISIDAYVTSQKNIKGIILRYRDLIINGESQITTTFINEKIRNKIKKIIKKLDLYGHIVLQAIITNEGKINLIECNPRFGGASTVSIKAGLDSFYWFYLESIGVNLDSISFLESAKPVKQIRIPKDIYK